MTPEDVLFKLGELQPDEIARLMKDSGVRALRSCSSACAVTEYMIRETGEQEVLTGADYLVYGKQYRVIGLPSTVQTFVDRFDHGFYPALDAMSPENQE